MAGTLEYKVNLSEGSKYASLFIFTTSEETNRTSYRIEILELEKAYSTGYYIGREEEDIKIDSPYVSRHQGHIRYEPNSRKWTYFQESGSADAYVNDEIVNTKIALDDRDIICLGNKRCYICFMQVRLNPNAHQVKYNRDNNGFVIGRDESCTVVLPIPYVSAKHAIVVEKNGDFWLFDNKSHNGTSYGKRRTNKTLLKKVDAFSIADVLFVKFGNHFFYSEPRKLSANVGSTLIEAKISEKKVFDENTGKEKRLLKDIDLEIKRGSLVAIIGGSGAGKSTLMNCLNGMDHSFDGDVFFDGINIKSSRSFEKVSYLIGSVPQKTLIHDYLTVEEELRQAAKLRRIHDTSRKEINQAVKNVILNDIKLDLKNDAKKRNSKLSGGQKRRVSIGMELVADREVLCLDEPDAGLDPLTKVQLFQMLRKLTRDKKLTILVIIHDISHMDIFDQVIILGRKDNEGRLVESCDEKDVLSKLGAKSYLEVYETIETNIDKYVKDKHVKDKHNL